MHKTISKHHIGTQLFWFALKNADPRNRMKGTSGAPHELPLVRTPIHSRKAAERKSFPFVSISLLFSYKIPIWKHRLPLIKLPAFGGASVVCPKPSQRSKHIAAPGTRTGLFPLEPLPNSPFSFEWVQDWKEGSLSLKT